MRLKRNFGILCHFWSEHEMFVKRFMQKHHPPLSFSNAVPQIHELVPGHH
jgi:hypothetical protein